MTSQDSGKAGWSYWRFHDTWTHPYHFRSSGSLYRWQRRQVTRFGEVTLGQEAAQVLGGVRRYVYIYSSNLPLTPAFLLQASVYTPCARTDNTRFWCVPPSPLQVQLVFPLLASLCLICNQKLAVRGWWRL